MGYIKDIKIGNGTTNLIEPILYGTTNTAAGTQAKVVSISNFELVTGVTVAVKFTVTNTHATPQLNINSTGAKSIKYRGGNLPSAATLTANRVYQFVYDGTNWELIGDLDTNTTYTAGNGININSNNQINWEWKVISENSPNLYKYIMTYTTTTAPTTEWFVKITLDRMWNPELTPIVIKAAYCNIAGILYLSLDSRSSYFKAYRTSYGDGNNNSNILAIKRINENSKNTIYLKLRQSKQYQGTIPQGTLTVYSPVFITSIEETTDPNDMIELADGYTSNTYVKANGFYGPLTGDVTGNASTATAFSADKSITLTGDITGSASSTGGWSIATTIGNGKVTNAMLAGSITNEKLDKSSITVGNTTINLGETGSLLDILYNSTTIKTDSSWDIYDPGVYSVLSSSTFQGTNNPENENTYGGLTPYRYGQLIVSRAGNGGVAQFYISHRDSNSNTYGIHFRTGWNNAYVAAWSVLIDSDNYKQYTVTKTGSGASGTWGISISGTAAKATGDADGNTISSTYLKLSGGTLTGILNITPATGEGGELHLKAATSEVTKNSIVLDNYYGAFRIFGGASADGTTKTGTGTPLVIDPYAKTITGGYTITGNLTGNVTGNVSGSAGSVALSGVTNADDLKAIEALTDTSGFLKKTAANTWALDACDDVVKKRDFLLTESNEEVDLIKLKPGVYDHISSFNNFLPTNWGTLLHIGGKYKYGAFIAAESANILYYKTYFYESDDNWFWREENWQTIAHATKSTSNIGSATQPVYMTSTGVITAGTALKALAYKDSLVASDIPELSTNKLTSGTLPIERGGTNATTVANATWNLLHISDPSDLNTAKRMGSFKISDSTTNTPESSMWGATWNIVDDNPNGNNGTSGTTWQLVFKAASTDMWLRTVTNGNDWTDYAKFLTDKHLQDGITSTSTTLAATANAAYTASRNSLHTLGTTTKFYLTGCSSRTTNTAGDIFDTGIYSTTTAGELSAVRHTLNLGGTDKAYMTWNNTDQSIDFVFN